MPRPLRIEFENAWYHVSNKGAGHRSIFLKPEHTALFVSILQDCIDTFDVEIHSFCFLSNSYHLLIKTPRGNLSQAMRQLNGMYTQRFNKDQALDGPLFKGRYRAIVLEESYLPPISRYIDLQPVICQHVEQPSQYKWSSYRAHIGKPSKLNWLKTDEIKARCQDYQSFVDEGIDPEIETFYQKKKQPAVMGSFQFKHNLKKSGTHQVVVPTPTGPSMDKILEATAKYFEVSIEKLKLSRRGQVNIPRSAAIYLSRKVGRHILTDIAAVYSGISHAAVGTTVKRFQHLLEKDASLRRAVECIIHNLQQHKSAEPSEKIAVVA